MKTFFGFGKQKWKWCYIRIKLYVILYIAFKKRNLSVQSTQSPFCHIITRSNENTASCFSVYDPVISDQMVVHCNLHVNKPSCPKRKITYPTLRSINMDDFRQDIVNADIFLSPGVSLTSICDQYDTVLTSSCDISIFIIVGVTLFTILVKFPSSVYTFFTKFPTAFAKYSFNTNILFIIFHYFSYS